jgi:hypothetical protein
MLTVDQQHEEVDIEIQRTANTLNERHRTGAGGPVRLRPS